MKKQLLAGLFVLTMLAGCGSSNSEEQKTACVYSKDDGMSVNFEVSSDSNVINKLDVNVTMTYDYMGIDLSSAKSSVKKSVSEAVLEQLGLDEDAKGISVEVDFTDEAMEADVVIDLAKADSTVLEKFGFDDLSEEDLNFEAFVKEAKNAGMECE